MLQFVFPALARTDEMLDLLGEPRLPGLDRLFARSRREPVAKTSLECALGRALGIARPDDLPIAAITLADSGAEAGGRYWLRADPVHLGIERDRLILREIPAPSQEEAERLCAALDAHFGAAFSPRPIRPDAWVIEVAEATAISTIPLSQAIGRPIGPFLPEGPATLHWRRLLNEAQMLLFHHPVNQRREARGEPAINSLWLWGGGPLPQTRGQCGQTVLCDEPDCRALAGFAGATVASLPKGWDAQLAEDAVVLMDAPQRHLRRGDFDAWLCALRAFEEDWLRPLLASGQAFALEDPLQGVRHVWHSTCRWKFWRRPPSPVRQTFGLEPPAADAGIDAFGNRY